MRRRVQVGGALVLSVAVGVAGTDRVCVWDHNRRATFDLTPLMKVATQPNYRITDGDLPCTKEVEEPFTYEFNLCGRVNEGSLPAYCLPLVSDSARSASAVRYVTGHGCYAAGVYDPNQDDAMWSLYDASDATKGVSLKYQSSDEYALCSSNVRPSTTIDVLCKDKSEVVVLSANEPEMCQYHITLESVWGCPRECRVGGNGRLCSNHGHCAWDSVRGAPHCFCNQGYEGVDCSEKAQASGGETTRPTDAQIGLLVPLVLISLGLVVALGFMLRKVRGYRVEALQYAELAGGDDEGIDMTF
uniref:EGF-like domain-containing protein n=1 Tax=Phaeomonas parva TaxID=124430 RepID=A0A7S1TRT5_9STRA|mmetsp:Transcript_14829/g.44685  ORF Transcript_14829/g.44685 Transcript_14829/m.44685 type:complete len:301 (+) Transcript_14829:214-1116(+)